MIELSRNISFGQYVNNDSPLTRMDPRAKLLCTIALIALASYVYSFIAFALCLVGCIPLQRESRISIGYILRSFKPILFILGFIFILQAILYNSPTQHTTLFWHWWIFSLSGEGMIRSAQAIIRVLFLYYLTSMLLFTTSLVDLTDGMEALLSPLQKLRLPINAFVMVLVIGFKFVPIFVLETERLMKAQAARGVRFDKGFFIQRAIKVSALLVPLFLSGLRRANTLATAMEARCYGGGNPDWRRSKRRALHFERYDILAFIFATGFCIIAVIVNIFAPF